MIYGGGTIGGAVARAFARDGARVFLAGRNPAKLSTAANDIRADGGQADITELDALDEIAVTRHAESVAAQTGGIDITLNAVGIAHVQGVPLAELSLEDYFLPVSVYTRTNFITAKVASRHMRRDGVLFLLATPAGSMPGPGFMGHNSACAAIEGMTRHLAGELASSGIRVICLKSHAIPEAAKAGSHSAGVFAEVATRMGSDVDTMLGGAAQSTLLQRLPTLEQIAETATFLASDRAGAITGAIVNLTCGAQVD
ncbi:SDR family oxidoreductase [Ferrovibrio terrae]|uniref:SDR family oxidoreductase n=1 Tax=Ferrovibrio terrae TaxID=2594003 RepID=A0A516H719_9PROT|nr:SDR family oxidoreductase [Ferrovibrio terrae]